MRIRPKRDAWPIVIILIASANFFLEKEYRGSHPFEMLKLHWEVKHFDRFLATDDNILWLLLPPLVLVIGMVLWSQRNARRR